MKSFLRNILPFCLIITFSAAQTDSLNITWDPNSDPDIHRYKLQRSLNSTNNFENFQTVTHPLTHVADHSVQPGRLYAYRVAAIDSAGNMSLYTTAVSVGIPEISWQLTSAVTGQNTTLPRSSFLNDPDHNASELQLEISQKNHLNVTVQGGNIILSPSPANYAGPASFILRAEDPDGLYDLKTVSLEFVESSAVFTVEIPDVAFDEDTNYIIFMDSTVSHSNYNPDQIAWSFMAGPDLSYSYNSSNRRLTLASKVPDWHGTERMIAIATAPDQSTQVDTFFVEIRPVNDPPQASIQNLFISPQSNNLFDLKLYAADVDHLPQELSWEFSGYSDFTIEWENEVEKIIRITPHSNATSESGTFRVSDPQGAFDSKQVTLTYTENNTPPHLFLADELFLAEDSALIVELVNFVVDSTHTISELSWEFNAGANLNLDYNSANHTLRIRPDHNWFGESSIEVTVRDPFGLADQQEISVFVTQRNDIEKLTIQYQNNGNVAVDIQLEMPSTVEFTYWYTLYQIVTVKLTNFQTRHLFTLGGVENDTTYHFNLTVRDDAGGTLAINDSVFTTGSGSSAPAGNELIVYPNPIKTARGHNEMIFANLPQETRKISLYSLMGERIYEEELSQPEPLEYRINIANNRVEFPSGLYIYLLRDEGSRVVGSGKIVIIR